MTETVSSPAARDIAGGNARHGLRVRLQMAARLVPEDADEARTVTIRDISVTGARMSVGDWPELPRAFSLLVRAAPGEMPYRLTCELRWKVGHVAGVRFNPPLPEPALLALTGLSAETHARAC